MRIKDYFWIGRDAVIEDWVIRIIWLDETDLNKDDMIYINQKRNRLRTIKPIKSYEEKIKVRQERYLKNKDKLKIYRNSYNLIKRNEK